jgi:predicted tellurium resistance membrane protein TerC
LQIVSGVENAYYATTAIAFFGFAFSFFLNSGSPVLVTLFLCIGMALMGFTYGPLGTFLSEFPTNIRYSGTSLAFNMAGIIRQHAYDCDLAGDSL